MSRMSILDGISLVTLQTQLATMQQALLALASGAEIATISYAQGDGNKSVSYRITDMGQLTQAILQVQTRIDTLTGQRHNRRAPMKPFF